MDPPAVADASLPVGVVKEIIEASDGPMPSRDSTVYVHYTGYIVSGESDDELFDSSAKRGPFSFPIGKDHTIPGLEAAVCTMREGEHARIIVPPAQAFGTLGNPQGFHDEAGMGCPIPSDATLMFDVRLLDVASPSMEGSALVRANLLKTVGNELFKRSEFERASLKYSRCLKTLEDTHGEEPKALRLASLANLTACYLNLSTVDMAIETGKKVLALDSQHVKTMFRISQAYLRKAMHKEAKDYIVKAIKLEPKNRQLRDHYVCVKAAIATARAKDKEVYSGVFSKLEEDELYTAEDVCRAKSRESKMKTCSICGERVEEVQYARHVIKKHT